MIPWQLFGLTPRDRVGGPTLRNWCHQGIENLNVQIEYVSLVVPKDRAAIVFGFGATLDSSTANPRRIAIDFYHGPNQSYFFASEHVNATAVYSKATSLYVNLGFVIAGPGDTISIQGDFDVAAATNYMAWTLSAVTIPRGDMSYL